MDTALAIINATLTVFRDDPWMLPGVVVAALVFAVGFAKRARVRVVLKPAEKQQNAEIAYTVAQRAAHLRLVAKRMTDKEVA